MKSLNVHEAKTQLSALLSEVENKGKSFIVCRHGKPIAELVPYKRKSRIQPHPTLSQIAIHYDPTEALSEDEWPNAL
ncbi:MAG: type II toxin-antitoxin system prevent-host-death family antitoxin [Vulcanimicrobiota bacterium]